MEIIRTNQRLKFANNSNRNGRSGKENGQTMPMMRGNTSDGVICYIVSPLIDRSI